MFAVEKVEPEVGSIFAYQVKFRFGTEVWTEIAMVDCSELVSRGEEAVQNFITVHSLRSWEEKNVTFLCPDTTSLIIQADE